MTQKCSPNRTFKFSGAKRVSLQTWLREFPIDCKSAANFDWSWIEFALSIDSWMAAAARVLVPTQLMDIRHPELYDKCWNFRHALGVSLARNLNRAPSGVCIWWGWCMSSLIYSHTNQFSMVRTCFSLNMRCGVRCQWTSEWWTPHKRGLEWSFCGCF